MSVEENKAVIHRMVEEVWNGGNIPLITELVAADYVYLNPRGDELRGPKGFERRVTVMRSAFSDLHMDIEDAFGEGAKVAYRLRTSGTFLGKLRDIEPNGKSFISRASAFARFENGKIVEEVEYIGEPTIFEQLGVVWTPRRE
jgi:steroid delta-isomerase-like uncharacterized protein